MEEMPSSEQLRELAEKVVKLILEDKELAAELCSCSSVIARQKCPEGHSCDSQFKCSLPFKCPKGHDIVKSTQLVEGRME